MKAIIRFILASLALTGVAVAGTGRPAPAHPADVLACRASGSYSRIVDGTPATFWLIAEEPAGAGLVRRYWHVESVGFIDPVFGYVGSHTVVCHGGVEVGPTEEPVLIYAIKGSSPCGTTTYVHKYPTPQTYSYLGEIAGWHDDGYERGTFRFVYWRVTEGAFAAAVYRHTQVVRC